MQNNLSQQPTNDKPEYLFGDVVVFIDSSKPKNLMTVHRVQGNSLLLDGNRTFALSALVRHADAHELDAGQRLGGVV